MKNKIKLIFGMIFVLLIFINFVNSAGIVSPYWRDYPLRMTQGETKIVNFNLQNLVGNQDVTVEVKLKQGSEIATLEKTTYTAKAGTSDTMIPLKISIPNNYNKQVQRIELEVKTVNSETEGMIVLGSGWTASFDVIVSEKEIEKRTLAWIIVLLILVIVVMALIIYILLNRKRR